MDHILRQNPVIVAREYIGCTRCGFDSDRPITWRDQGLGRRVIPVRAA